MAGDGPKRPRGKRARLHGETDFAGAPTLGREVHPEGREHGAVALEDTLITEPTPRPAAHDDAGEGSRIGRFLVLGTIGEGGMGRVVAAYDPDLDRKVAIKLLKPLVWQRTGSSGRQRLLREARAMAKVSHANVLTVHEVGTIDDRVYVATEFASGGTLTQWLAEKERPWREVVARFAAAGRGLAAAHAAGLVHRDFKPDNVLLTAVGEVRVADFGLVGTRATEPFDSKSIAIAREATGSEDPLSTQLTQDGALMGTPAYMAPEQHRGELADTRSDQFAFCVSLYQALYGERPFRGGDYDELVDRVARGAVEPAPRNTDVPEWLRAVVVRGLAPSPDDRHASMEALLDALAADPAAARRRRLRAVAGVAVVAGLAAIATVALVGSSHRTTMCRDANTHLRGVWDADRRALVDRVFRATGKNHAADTSARTARLLDEYTDTWIAERTDACQATHMRGEQSHALLDLRMQCLDRRLGELDALILVLTDPETASLSIDRATQAASQLVQPEVCGDTERLTALMPPPADPALADRVRALRAQLDRARALEQAGRYEEAHALAAKLADAAQETSYEPVIAEALFRRGVLEDWTANPDAALRTYTAALEAAARARDDGLAADIWLEILWTVVASQGRGAQALELIELANAALVRAGDDDRRRVTWLMRRSSSLLGAGEIDRAIADAERAVELQTRTHGEPTPRAINALSNAYKEAGRAEEALVLAKRALELDEARLGPNHPEVAIDLGMISILLLDLGRLDEADGYCERALSSLTVAFGPNHMFVGIATLNGGLARSMRGDFAGALELTERAEALLAANGAPDHDGLARARANLAAYLLRAGRCEEALRFAALAADTFERKGASTLADALAERAKALLCLQRPREAVAAAERAVEIAERDPVDTRLRATARDALARARWATGDRPAARELARAARDDYEASHRAYLMRDVEDWIATH